MDTWRQCLKSYLESLTAAGESHPLIQDHTTTLERFFIQHDPEAVTRDQVTQFCEQPSYHGAPSDQTVKRRKAAIRAYFDYAASQGIFAGPNPAKPPAREVKPLFADEHWQAAYEAFLQEVSKSDSEATRISYKGILTRFFSEHPDPCIVSRSQISQFIQSVTNGPHKKGTMPATATKNQRATILKMFFDFCSAWTIPGPTGPTELFRLSNPVAGYKHHTPNRAYKTLTTDELKRFFACMSDPTDILLARDAACFYTYLVTCRRREELAGLLWGDISFGPIVDQDGSVREAYSFRFFGKGHSHEADIQELPIECYEKICAYLQLSGRLQTIRPQDPVFAAHVNQHGGPSNVRPGELRPLTSGSIAKRLKHYCRLAGISEAKFSMHSLRHSGAWLRKISGSDLYSVSRVLRHKSLQTTAIYLEALQVSSDQDSKLVTSHLARYGIQ